MNKYIETEETLMALATLTSRVEENDKALFISFCDSVGLTSSAAINMFVKAVNREHRIPFEIKVDFPNKETIEAMKEAERIAKDPKVKSYTVDEAFAELDQ